MKTSRRQNFGRPVREGAKLSVRAAGLPGLLDQAPQDVRILSLDCFDTLIWRNVQAPLDIFSDLGLPGGGDFGFHIQVQSASCRRTRSSAAFLIWQMRAAPTPRVWPISSRFISSTK